MNKNDTLNSLLILLAEGDQAAFRKIYYMYYDRLFRFAIHLIKDEMSSEEIVSDVLLNIWLSREKMTDVTDFNAFLYKSVKNQALHYIDKTNRRIKCEDLSVDIEYIADDSDPENLMLYDELNRQLKKAIESLPEKCRIIFKLAREDGLPYIKIADILGISVKTIDAQMAIAKQKIEQIVKRYLNG